MTTVNDVELDLVGISEIRRMVGGLSRQRVNVIANTKGFPDPVADLGMGKVWLRSDVHAWIARHRPELAQE